MNKIFTIWKRDASALDWPTVLAKTPVKLMGVLPGGTHAVVRAHLITQMQRTYDALGPSFYVFPNSDLDHPKA